MGYWRQDIGGHSMMLEETGLTWGGQPADIMDDALDQIIAVFRRDRGRPPLIEEVRAGLLFSLRAALQRDKEEHEDA